MRRATTAAVAQAPAGCPHHPNKRQSNRSDHSPAPCHHRGSDNGCPTCSAKITATKARSESAPAPAAFVAALVTAIPSPPIFLVPPVEARTHASRLPAPTLLSLHCAHVT
jgi:hypothetical protein